MEPIKLKACKSLDLDSKLKAYVIKTFDEQSLNEELSNFFSTITQNQGVISKMPDMKLSLDSLRQNRTIVIAYLNQLAMLKEKMTFGKENYSCKIEFTWRDTIKDSKWSSYNIYFEYYNVMFNLATIYYLMGVEIRKTSEKDRDKMKEAVKQFKYAMYLFEAIKEEACKKITAKELPYDLTPVFMDYCIQLCTLMGQTEILKIAGPTKSVKGVQPQLCQCISDVYKNAYNLSDQSPVSKGGDDDFRAFLNNRSIYYQALVYQKLKEGKLEEYENSGEGYGVALYYQGLFVATLLECQKTIKKCGNYANKEQFEKMIEKEKEIGADMDDKNNKIYHQTVPTEPPNPIQPLNMMSALIPEDLYHGENVSKLKSNPEIYCKSLNLLINKEMKEMIDRYKMKMNVIIQQGIEKSENETTIKEFINKLNLPNFIASRNEEKLTPKSSVEIPPQLWSKIANIQNLGGSAGLNNMMQGIINKNNKMIADLENTLNSFSNEERDDMMQRQRYGEQKWFRKPSNVLNPGFINPIKKFIAQLQQMKQFDQQQLSEISNNVKFFGILAYSRDQLNERIPGRVVDASKKELNTDERKCRAAILSLYDLGDQCMNVINPIYKDLNDDSKIHSLFVEVLAGNTTEQAIFDKNKEDYERKFSELIVLSQKVNAQKQEVQRCYNEIAHDYTNSQGKQQLSEEAIQFLNQIENNCNIFMSIYDKVRKGDKYYNEQGIMVADIIRKSNQWMINRNEEKKIMVANLNGNSQMNYMGASSFENAEKNTWTNKIGGNQGFKGYKGQY